MFRDKKTGEIVNTFTGSAYTLHTIWEIEGPNYMAIFQNSY